jgi:CMP-N,N'-diacetyllegionaminic acid synthase
LKVLIVGYGSIGKRHENVLCSLQNIKRVDIVTKQLLEDKTVFKSLETVPNLEIYDYFIIASETNKHYEQLSYLERELSDKIIFCEKPLFETQKILKIVKNRVYIGYVLRFHPLLQKLKRFIENEKVISINVNCGQYLPTWRVDSDYRKSYSAKKDEGGGVLLDLSHEIDYTQWLCGKMKELKSYQVKVSDLEIDSDDLTTFIGKTDNEVMVNLSIDYISKITYRRVLIHTLENSYELDFIHNNLIKKDKLANEEIFTANNLQRNVMFEEMHRSILNDKSSVCSYNEALDVMDTISTIQEQNR